MSFPAFLKIYISCIAAVCFPNSFTQAVFCSGHGDEVHVIRHHTVGPDHNLAAVTPLGHQMEIFSVIGFTEKCFHPAIAALGYVMGYIGSYNPCETCHD
jgi:hypothetical protein